LIAANLNSEILDEGHGKSTYVASVEMPFLSANHDAKTLTMQA
jgi:hypothetical protein